MRKVSCLLATAAGLVLGVSTAPSAFAFDPPFAWFGAMIIESTTTVCGSRIQPGDAPGIVFRPELQAAEPSSALTYQFGHSSGIIIKQGSTLQFKGAGSFSGAFLSGRATQESNAGTYNLAVTPATVTSTTLFISFTGSISGFAGKDGCNVTVRGSAVQRQ